MSSLFRRCVLVSSLVAVALSTPSWPFLPSFQLPFALPHAGWSTASPAYPCVSIEQGTIVGSVLRDASAPQAVEAFRGISYALPPVGDRRFRPAVPVGASRATVHATEFGARCVFHDFALNRVDSEFTQVSRKAAASAAGERREGE